MFFLRYLYYIQIPGTPTRTVGRDSSVSLATRYGLDGPGSNLGGGEIFRIRP